MYSALSGNLAAMKKLDTIANNLANANTTGFKRDRLAFESLLASNTNPPAVPPGQTADPVLHQERLLTDFTSGSLVQTGNKLDFALEGDGFFVVRMPDGNDAYTRQGNFRTTADGSLVTTEGYPVLSKAGQPIKITEGTPIVGKEGIITVNGNQVGDLAIVDFPKPYNLQKTANALFLPVGPNVTAQAASANTSVEQGAIEQSNVDSIGEMVQMVEAARYFEACQRVVRNFDDIAAKAINDLGRV
jgi:flagellar basal-body rod protein FlgG